MRRIAILLACALATVPLVGTIHLRADPAPLPDVADGIPDSHLVWLLARHAGYDLAPPQPVAVPSDATLPDLVLRLAHRMGAPLAPQDTAAFHTLDPRVAAPLRALLVAVERAWDLRDAAFAHASDHDLRELETLLRHDEPDSRRARDLRAPIAPAPLLEASLLLLATLEDAVVPALQEAIDAGAWPAAGLGDPAGVLRLGSMGDDTDTQHRMIHLDPRGNDQWRNNAGGNQLLADLDPRTPDFPLAIAIDFAGHDTYDAPRRAQGSAFAGIGILLDLGGNDKYGGCSDFCQGAAGIGVGILRDSSGEDDFTTGVQSIGYGGYVGMVRNDGGNDTYRASAMAGGYSADPAGIAMLWDRSGHDEYISVHGTARWLFGWGETGGRGWLLDEGPEDDFYGTAGADLYRHGCNNCTWTMGTGFLGFPTNGRGVDNAGGLAAVVGPIG